MFGVSKSVLTMLRATYKEGTRVSLNYMDDPHAPKAGTCGTVVGVDDAGQIMVHWDNGSSLSVIYGVDSVSIVG